MNYTFSVFDTRVRSKVRNANFKPHCRKVVEVIHYDINGVSTVIVRFIIRTVIRFKVCATRWRMLLNNEIFAGCDNGWNRGRHWDRKRS